VPDPADLTSLLSYEWIEIETVACSACSRDIKICPKLGVRRAAGEIEDWRKKAYLRAKKGV
jgi:hypothetical protein